MLPLSKFVRIVSGWFCSDEQVFDAPPAKAITNMRTNIGESNWSADGDFIQKHGEKKIMKFGDVGTPRRKECFSSISDKLSDWKIETQKYSIKEVHHKINPNCDIYV